MHKTFVIKPKLNSTGYLILFICSPFFALSLWGLVEMAISKPGSVNILLFFLLALYLFLLAFFNWERIRIFEDRIELRKGLWTLGFKQVFKKEEILRIKIQYNHMDSPITNDPFRFQIAPMFKPSQWRINLLLHSKKIHIGSRISKVEGIEIMSELRLQKYPVE